MQLAVFDDLEHLWHAGPDYWDAYMADLDVHTLIRLTPGALGVGAGAPRVRTEAGFLLFFHERPPTAHTRSTWRCWTRSLVDCRAASPNRYSSRSSTGSSGAMWTTSSSPGSALRR
jgi:hypothetical protein